jgi:hypothetical protein
MDQEHLVHITHGLRLTIGNSLDQAVEMGCICVCLWSRGNVQYPILSKFIRSPSICCIFFEIQGCSNYFFTREIGTILSHNSLRPKMLGHVSAGIPYLLVSLSHGYPRDFCMATKLL